MDRKWLKIGSGIAGGVVTIVGLFFLLINLYNFQITGTDDSCKGTLTDPCISYISVYNPNMYNVDIYNQNEIKLSFMPKIKEYYLFREDGRCKGGTSCAAPNGISLKGWNYIDFTEATKPVKDKAYVFRFPAKETKKFLLWGLKEKPEDIIKWNFITGKGELDPQWIPEDVIEVHSFSKVNGSVSYLDKDKNLEITLSGKDKKKISDFSLITIENTPEKVKFGFNLTSQQEEVTFKVSSNNQLLQSSELSVSYLDNIKSDKFGLDEVSTEEWVTIDFSDLKEKNPHSVITSKLTGSSFEITCENCTDLDPSITHTFTSNLGGNYSNTTFDSTLKAITLSPDANLIYLPELNLYGNTFLDYSTNVRNIILPTYHTKLNTDGHSAWDGISLNFNGSYINNVLSLNTISLNNPLGVTVVIKFSTLDILASYGGLVQARQSDFGIGLSLLGGKYLACGGGNGSNNNFNLTQVTETGVGSNNGSIVCAACQYNGTNYNLIKQGTLLGTRLIPDYASSSILQPQIGSAVSSVYYAYSGKIYNVGIFNRSLTGQETVDFCNGAFIEAPANTVLDMPFEFGSNNTWTRDYALGNNGTVVGAIWNATGGYDGKGAYMFDGIDDSIITPVSTSLNLYNYTYGGIIKLSSYKPSVIIAKRDILNSTITSYLALDVNGLLYCYTGTSPYPYSTTPLNLNTNYHVMCRYNGTHLSTYINGVLDKTASALNGSAEQAGSWGIGVSLSSYYFNGSIDKLQLYNVSLTPAQILSIYQNGTPPMGEKVEYLFNQNEGDITTDLSGNNNHGNLTNYVRPLWLPQSVFPQPPAPSRFVCDGKDDYMTFPINKNTLIGNNSFVQCVTFFPQGTSPTCSSLATCAPILGDSSGSIEIVRGVKGGEDKIFSYFAHNNPGGTVTVNFSYNPTMPITACIMRNSTDYCLYNGTSSFSCTPLPPSADPQGMAGTNSFCKGWTSNTIFFNGTINNFYSIVNRSMSHEEINSLITQIQSNTYIPAYRSQGSYLGNFMDVLTYSKFGNQTISGWFDNDTAQNYDYDNSIQYARFTFDGTPNDNIAGFEGVSFNVSSSHIGLNGSYYFNGVSSRIHTNPSILLGIKNYTVSVFFKAKNRGSMIINKENSINTSSQLQMYLITGTNNAYCYSGLSPYPASTTVFTDNTWYQLACQYDGTNLSIWVNGVMESSKNCANCWVNKSGVWRFGNSFGTSYFYEGWIDNVQIYNKSLTAQEMMNEYRKITGLQTQIQFRTSEDNVTFTAFNPATLPGLSTGYSANPLVPYGRSGQYLFNFNSADPEFTPIINNITVSYENFPCTCPPINQNWQVNMSKYCILDVLACNISGYNLTFVAMDTATGNFTVNTLFEVDHIKGIANGMIMYIKSLANILMKG